MIVVTHEMGFARKAADRVVFMADGQIVEEADPRGVLHQPAERPGQGLPGQDPHPLTTHRHAAGGRHRGRGRTTQEEHTDEAFDESEPSQPPRRSRSRLAACGDAATRLGGSGSGGGGGLKIGIKFDQPGLGLKKGTDVHRLRRRRRQVRRQGARHAEDSDITWVAGPERPARDADLDRPGRL